MPLFKVQVRTKGEESAPAAQAPPPLEEAPPTQGESAPPKDQKRAASSLTAIVGGVLFGLVLVATVSFYLVKSNTDGAAAERATAISTPGVSVDPAESGAVDPAPSDFETGPASINPEYRLEDVIAQVNGAPISMRDLDRSVRVARVLGELTGDQVPANSDPEMRQFQVGMLKRLVDLELMHQAAEGDGMLIPGGETQSVVDGFLAEAGKTSEDLDQAMALHNVSAEELDRWFRSARTANYFVVQNLMVGNETGSRDEITADWLREQWDSQQIVVNFYDPDE